MLLSTYMQWCAKFKKNAYKLSTEIPKNQISKVAILVG